MPFTARRTAIGLIALFFGLVSALGEGLHLFPGCGHYLETRWGILAIGVRPAVAPSPFEGGERLKRPTRDSVPVLQPGQCPICSVIAQVKQSAKSQSVDLFTRLVTYLAPGATANSTCDEARPFRARAPPVG